MGCPLSNDRINEAISLIVSARCLQKFLYIIHVIGITEDDLIELIDQMKKEPIEPEIHLDAIHDLSEKYQDVFTCPTYLPSFLKKVYGYKEYVNRALPSYVNIEVRNIFKHDKNGERAYGRITRIPD